MIDRILIKMMRVTHTYTVLHACVVCAGWIVTALMLMGALALVMYYYGSMPDDTLGLDVKPVTEWIWNE